MTLDLNVVLAPYGQCKCCANGKRCFRIPPQPDNALCHPCFTNNCAEHGYAGIIVEQAAAPPAQPVPPSLATCVQQVVAWLRVHGAATRANYLGVLASETGLNGVPPPPVGLYPMAVHCALCEHERADHPAAHECAYTSTHPDTGRLTVCACPRFRVPGEPGA